jgi:ElaB/YqjD/DUF883 family membrane-anchored ribosome-binding protein
MGDAGNGRARDASSATERQPHDSRSLGDHGRQIEHDAEALAAAVRDATAGVQRYLTAQVEQRPFSTLGVAAGVGYVLGGGLSSRLTVVLLGAATRVATALVARELGSRILQSSSASAQNTGS